MIVFASTKQALPSIRRCFYCNVLHEKKIPFTRLLNSSTSLRRSSGRNGNKRVPQQQQQQQQQHNRRRCRQQQQQQHTHQDENHNHKNWPTMMSVLIVPVMFGGWCVTDSLFRNNLTSYNEELRQQFLVENQKYLLHDEDCRSQKEHNDHNDVGDSNNSNKNNQNHTHTVSTILFQNKPILFHCIIRKNTGFAHCLADVQIGDAVEVIEEGVGPDRAYNLCRLITSKTLASTGSDDESIVHEDASYGWFPIRWLQKLEHYNATIQQQQADSDDVAS